MAKLLYITANPKPIEQSYSLSTGRRFIEAYKAHHPEDSITELDLFNMDIPFIDSDILNAWGKLQSEAGFDALTQTERDKVTRLNVFTDQFVAADKYVFVTPLWNFTVPPVMKAYLDTICIAGRTFKYTAEGPVGLLTNKKALHIQASGGVYSQGPANAFELGSRYIGTVMRFIGIEVFDVLFVEDTAQDTVKAEDLRRDSMGRAEGKAENF